MDEIAKGTKKDKKGNSFISTALKYPNGCYEFVYKFPGGRYNLTFGKSSVKITRTNGANKEIHYSDLKSFGPSYGIQGKATDGKMVNIFMQYMDEGVYNVLMEELKQFEGFKISRKGKGILRRFGESVEDAMPIGSFQKREKISRELYENFFARHCYKAMCDKKNAYLAAFNGDPNYQDLEKLYGYLPDLYNKYVSAIIGTKLYTKAPINPYTAAFVGTAVGGTAVGMVAAHNAIEKQKAYQENGKQVAESRQKIQLSHDSVESCYASIEYLINENETTRNDWVKEKENIIADLERQYKVK